MGVAWCGMKGWVGARLVQAGRGAGRGLGADFLEMAMYCEGTNDGYDYWVG